MLPGTGPLIGKILKPAFANYTLLPIFAVLFETRTRQA
jgi:hypothetical protein